MIKRWVEWVSLGLLLLLLLKLPISLLHLLIAMLFLEVSGIDHPNLYTITVPNSKSSIRDPKTT